MFTVRIDSPLVLTRRNIADTNRLRRLDGLQVDGDTLDIARTLDREWKATSGSVFRVDPDGYIQLGTVLVGRLHSVDTAIPAPRSSDEDLSMEDATVGTRPGRLVFLGVGRRA